MDLLNNLIICSSCRNPINFVDYSENANSITCEKCKTKFAFSKNYIDFLLLNKVDSIEETSISTWGGGNHKNNQKPATNHFKTINKKLGGILEKKLKGKVLDIGCGSGFDTKQISELKNVTKTFAVDIGSNAIKVAHQNPQAFVMRANCLNLPFQVNSFDSIYSYGVFHHTSNPLLAIKEASRVLKQGGNIFIYVYTSHSKNFPKKIGIVIENLLMKFFAYLPYKLKNFICICICPIAWISFTLPSRILNILGLSEFSKKFPMHWGTTPFSILPDIKDRLLAPINYRYSIESFSRLLKLSSLKILNINEDYSGIYVHAIKK